MTPLRQRMLQDLQLRNFSAGTQRSYIHYIAQFAAYFGQSPDRLGLDDVRNYQLHLIEQKQLSPQSINCFVAAAKFLYTVTLDMPWTKENFPRMKVPERLPFVLSLAEVQEFFQHVGLLKHRAALMLCYGSGLRSSEAVTLQPADIDSDRGRLLAQLVDQYIGERFDFREVMRGLLVDLLCQQLLALGRFGALFQGSDVACGPFRDLVLEGLVGILGGFADRAFERLLCN